MNVTPESKRDEGRVVTFYSYKGGTGRSMAMANVSWVLALSGFKVLVVDWDLEAPGLHRYFRPFLDDPDLSESDGLIDFVIHFAEAASEQMEDPADADWYKPYSNLLPYAKELNYEFPAGGALDFIAAGRQNNAYAVRVNSFNWKHFYEKLDGGRVLEEARRILKDEYDYILIDSRTGVSDTAGICTVEMPDDLVVCFTLNLQSVIGASSAAASVIEQRVLRQRPIRAFPIPMRVEAAEKLKTETMKTFAKPRFLPLLPADMTEEQRERYWSESDVLYIPFYAFEENLAYFRDEPDSPNSVLAAMIRIANRLTPSAIAPLPRPGAEERAGVIAKYDAFSGPQSASIEAPKPRATVYISFGSDAAGLTIDEQPEPEILSLERYAKARAAVFLLAIGAEGLTASQSTDLALAERRRIGPIYIVLLPGSQPETLPRLLLPYGAIDLRAGGGLKLPDATNGELVGHLPVPPYPGLNPFTSLDGPMFIARGAVTTRIVEALKPSGFVALTGPRHSGRRSLVQAGVIPRLKSLSPPNPSWDVRFGWQDPIATSGPTLIVVDANALTAAPLSKLPPDVCILMIAEGPDQIAFCEKKLGMTAERIEIPPLSETELMAAITEPAVKSGLRIEPGLAERIVADLKIEKAQLPLMQYVMSELYAAEPRGILSSSKYEGMGGLAMIERKCEQVAGGVGVNALSRLVLVTDGGGMTTLDAPEVSIRAQDRGILQAYILAGIVVREGEFVRFSNRIFLDRWERLRRWVEENREFLLWRQRLNQSLGAWQANPRTFTLLTGEALVLAKRHAAERPGDLNEQEMAYIQASANNPIAEAPKVSASRGRDREWLLILIALVLSAAVGWLLFKWISPANSNGVDKAIAASVQANNLLQEKNYPGAIEALTRALVTPYNATQTEQMYRSRAFAYSKLPSPDWKHAIADLTRALSLARVAGEQKEIAALLRDRAAAYVQIRDPELAIADLEELSKYSSSPWINMGLDSLRTIFDARGEPGNLYIVAKAGMKSAELPPAITKPYGKFGFIHLRGWAYPIPDNELRYTDSADAAIAQKAVAALRASGIVVSGPVQMRPAAGRARYIQLWLAWK